MIYTNVREVEERGDGISQMSLKKNGTDRMAMGFAIVAYRLWSD